MSSVLEKNLRLCRRHWPNVYCELQEVTTDERYICYQTETPNRTLNLYDSRTDRIYYENSDPLGSAAEHLSERCGNLQGITLFFGFGLGYGPLLLLNTKSHFERALLIFEKDPRVILKAFEHIDFEELFRSDDVNLLTGRQLKHCSSDIYRILCRDNLHYHAKNIHPVELPASYHVHKADYDEVMNEVSSAVRLRCMGIGNDFEDTLVGLANSIDNLPKTASLPSFGDLRNAFTGKPGVVVSTGPSLDKNVGLLEKVIGKAVIACPDASLPILRTRGIRPNFVTCLERRPKTSTFFSALQPDDFEDSFLVTTPVVHPKSLLFYKGEKVMAEREYSFMEWLSFDHGTLATGPSAGNMAFQVLKYLGCSPIILIGQDFALGEDGATHAKDFTLGQGQKGYLREPTTVEGNYSDKVKANVTLNLFREAMEAQIAEAKEAGIHCINATEGGAKISGAEISSFQNAIASHISALDPVDIVGSIRTRIIRPTMDVQQKRLQGAIESLSEAVKFVSQSLDTVDKVLAECDILLESLDTGSIDESECVSRLNEIDAISRLVMSDKFQIYCMDFSQQTYFQFMTTYIQRLSSLSSESEKPKVIAEESALLAKALAKLLSLLHDFYSQKEEDFAQQRISETVEAERLIAQK